ncbi:MAG: hypothetical protein K5985_11075 [Lachnospiraceae bacterium]|nr:hypothetical protein [Lachnospiraceae bacterium]
MGNALENVGRSLIGNVAKAILCIRNPGSITDDLDNSKEGDLLVGEAAAIKDIAGEAGHPEQGLEGTLMKSAAEALKKKKTLGYSDVKTKAKAKNYIALQMQYNPSSLRFDTTAGRQMNYGRNGADTSLQQYIAPASTTLSCELLFDDVNNMDAFMLSDLPLSTGQILSFGKSVVTNARGMDYSVQDQLEGLISLMAVPEAKQVIFFWGNMSFRGEMVQVTTTYTMFNKKGYPIRGKAAISIRQGDSSKDEEAAYRYDNTYWDNAVDTMFAMDRGKQGTFEKITNNNLLNLNI